MNQQIVDIAFCVLFASCIGVFPVSRVIGNNLLLIWGIITMFAGFAAMFIDAVGVANIWYYGPMCCVMTGIFSYYYLQQYGKR